jgi:hypothetical protein
MIMGASGSGKTASLRGFKDGDVFVFNVASKELPFKCDWREKKYVYDKPSYDDIERVMLKASESKDNKCKAFVIDDSQYLMAFESFEKAKIVGYGKFTDIAVNFYHLLDFVQNRLPRDYIVYFLHHTQVDDETGFKHVKTIGKMLDNQLTVEGMFSIVLLTDVTQGKHTFITNNNDGLSTAKSPIGMFDEEKVDNDLQKVDDTIRKFYGLKEKAKNE